MFGYLSLRCHDKFWEFELPLYGKIFSMRVFLPVRIITRSFGDFFRDGGIMLAGSLSYFFMMAVIPFSLFLIAMIGYFLGSRDDIARFLVGKLVAFFPSVTHEITDEFRRLISLKKTLGSFSAILYGFLSFQLYMALQNALAVVFKITTQRPFLIALLLAIFVVTLVMFLVLVSFGATTLVLMLRILRQSFPELQLGGVASLLVSYAIPFVLVLLTTAGIYKIFPHRMIRMSHAFCGALFTTLFLEIAKHLFTFYVSDVMHLGTMYGPLSAFIMFLLWVFYSWCIFLLGAEIVHNCAVMAPAAGLRAAKK
ncbi:MAG TPA: YihY/virulence factor BrkB family protein [Dissulfurispiraceae bacterium]|nr:YihY/virulence factor BrkB family protein [Dissulfurispiraceae bacterium]